MNEQQRLKPFPHTMLITQSIPTPDGWVKELYRRDELMPPVAIQRMIKRVGEAANGHGTATSALEMLKLDANELQGLTSYAMFKQIDEAIEQLPGKGLQQVTRIALFDMEGIGHQQRACDSPKRLLEQDLQEQVDRDYEAREL